MDGHHLGDREGAEAQNPAYDRLTVTYRPDQGDYCALVTSGGITQTCGAAE